MVQLWGLSTHKVFEDARNKFINLLFYFIWFFPSQNRTFISYSPVVVVFRLLYPLTYYLTKNRSNCVIEKCLQYYYIVEFCCDSLIPLRSSSVYWFSGIPDLDNDGTGSMIENCAAFAGRTPSSFSNWTLLISAHELIPCSHCKYVLNCYFRLLVFWKKCTENKSTYI